MNPDLPERTDLHDPREDKVAQFTYEGKELRLLGSAVNGKSYYSGMIKPYLGNCVLEVGAGLGMTTPHLCDGRVDRWVCLEPDPVQAKHIEERIRHRRLTGCCEVKTGTVDDLPDDNSFDSIVYINVLEHIYDDVTQLVRATDHLSSGGHLIVLAPAHLFLFSGFDIAVGHHRRYTKQSLSAAVPDGLGRVLLRYLDTLGLILSLGHRFRKKSLPEKWQVDFWDRFLVPISVRLDRSLNYRIGKSVLGVWQKPY